MRWRFHNPNDPDEASQHNAVVEKIDAWWREFQTKTEDLAAFFDQKTKWNLPEWMAEHLHAIDPRLMWEFGTALNCDGHRLVITPEVEHHLRPLTATIIEKAPKIDGWEFYPHRVPEDLDMAQKTVEARTGGDLTDVGVYVELGEHNKIDLCFCSPRINEFDDEKAIGEAFVAAESLLGEDCLNRWIGDIKVDPVADTFILRGLRRIIGSRLTPVGELKSAVDALIEKVRRQLPDEPHHKWIETTSWTGRKLKPDRSEDYPEQLDLAVGTSGNRDL